jgi:PAS domain S-box-containing protein
MDYSSLSKEELIRIIDVLNGRLEVHNLRLMELRSERATEIEISNIETYWKQIIDSLPVSVSLHDSVGYTTLNKFGSSLSGYSEEEWINMPETERALIMEFPAKPETLIFFDMFTKQGKDPEKDIIELEIKLRTKDGKWLWLHTTNSYVYNPLKNDFEVLTAAIDITHRKNHELEIEKLNLELNELLGRERKLAHENEELLQKQIQDKNTELNRLAVFLTEKNNCLLKLKHQATTLSKANENELKEIAQNIIESIDSKLNSESAWNTFEIQFETANPKFLKNLKKKFPDLSKAELKVCSLVKTELSTKAISSILNLSKRTVDAHRYNIRMKMKLHKNHQLSNILNSVRTI